jgi:hypothetical protein
MISLKDRAKFEKSIRALVERYPDVLAMHGKERAPRLRHRRTRFAGQDLHLLELSTHRGEPIPVVPCWTVADDHVAFALWPHSLKNHLSKRPTLAENRAYAAARKRIPDGAVSHTYLDLPRVVGFVYNTMAPLLQGLQGAVDRKLEPFGTALNLHDLPRAAVITKHLSPCISYTKVEDDALRFGYVSPFGAGLGVGGIVGIGATTGLAVSLIRKAEMEERIEELRTERELAEARRDLEVQRAARAKERARWEARLAKLEAELAELRKLIQEEK